MVQYTTHRNVFPIIDVAVPGARLAQALWLAESAEIITTKGVGTVIVYDFSYTTSTIVEYTLDDGVNWIEINDALALAGGQSRYLRVENGDKVNFRGTDAGTLNRLILSQP